MRFSKLKCVRLHRKSMGIQSFSLIFNRNFRLSYKRGFLKSHFVFLDLLTFCIISFSSELGFQKFGMLRNHRQLCFSEHPKTLKSCENWKHQSKNSVDQASNYDTQFMNPLDRIRALSVVYHFLNLNRSFSCYDLSDLPSALVVAPSPNIREAWPTEMTRE